MLRPNQNIPRHQMMLPNQHQRPRLPYIPNNFQHQQGSLPAPGQRFSAVNLPMPAVNNGVSQTTAQSSFSASKSDPKFAQADKNKPWGWTSMDGVIVPYILRGKEKYVSVKMVESKMLSKFPKINMDDMTNVGPIYSYYITDSEAKLLTEINTRCYNHGFGTKSFNTKDLIVSLENFTSFYNRAKAHFTEKLGVIEAKITGGWLQINNTVVPYLLRNGVKFVPLSVIKYAAGLLTDIRMGSYKVPCTEQEYIFLNNCCRSSRINFTFSIKTKLIKIEHVIRMCQSKVNIIELPQQDPLSHAHYQFDRQAEGEMEPNASMQGYQLPIMHPVMQQAAQQHPHQPPQQMSPPNLMSVPQHMPPRNPFIHHNTRPVQMATHMPAPAPPTYAQRSHVPFIRHQGPSPVAAISPMTRDMRTPSPSISPRTQEQQMFVRGGQRPPSNSNSSASNSRPSSAQSRGSITPPTTNQDLAAKSNLGKTEPIQVYKFEGKNLSCLLRGIDKEPFALLEALVQLYFPQCSLSELKSALERVHVPVHQLDGEEEHAFIRFYELKVKSLRSKAVVSYVKFKKVYEKLVDTFLKGAKVKASKDVTETSQTVAVEDELDMVFNNNNTCANDDTESEQARDRNKRKLSSSSQSVKKPKLSNKRLEDFVAKLRMRQGSQTPTDEVDAHIHLSEDETQSDQVVPTEDDDSRAGLSSDSAEKVEESMNTQENENENVLPQDSIVSEEMKSNEELNIDDEKKADTISTMTLPTVTKINETDDANCDTIEKEQSIHVEENEKQDPVAPQTDLVDFDLEMNEQIMENKTDLEVLEGSEASSPSTRHMQVDERSSAVESETIQYNSTSDDHLINNKVAVSEISPDLRELKFEEKSKHPIESSAMSPEKATLSRVTWDSDSHLLGDIVKTSDDPLPETAVVEHDKQPTNANSTCVTGKLMEPEIKNDREPDENMSLQLNKTKAFSSEVSKQSELIEENTDPLKDDNSKKENEVVSYSSTLFSDALVSEPSPSMDSTNAIAVENSAKINSQIGDNSSQELGENADAQSESKIAHDIDCIFEQPLPTDIMGDKVIPVPIDSNVITSGAAAESHDDGDNEEDATVTCRFIIENVVGTNNTSEELSENPMETNNEVAEEHLVN